MIPPGHHEHARLTALLETYGANIARWPRDERPTTAALAAALGRDDALATAFADAAALDRMLGTVDVPGADDLHAHRLQQHILAALPPQPPAEPASQSVLDASRAADPRHGRRTRVPAWLRPALAALVPLVIGFGAGLSSDGSYPTEPAAPLTWTRDGVVTPVDTDTQYADETTMAPFLLAANMELMAEEMRQ